MATVMIPPILAAETKIRDVFTIFERHFELCVGVLLRVAKFAVTVRLAYMTIVTGFPVPDKPPDQPANSYPSSATAFKITFSPRA